MGAISAANVITFLDKETALWLAGLGTDVAAYGLRTVGASAGAYKKAADQVAAVQALSDEYVQAILLSGAITARTNIDAFKVIGPTRKPFLDVLEAACAQAGLSGIQTLDAFLTYYNTATGGGGPWNCLQAPDFRDLFYSWKGAYPTATNLYFEILQGATYTNAIAKWIVSGAGTGNLTAGTNIDSTKYAGGFGQVNVSGLTGSGVVTVTGNWRKTDGTVATGAAGTATVSGNGVTVLTPPFTNALLLTVTAIAAANGITAGTIYAEAKRPSGRSNPPS